jgi:hypothetical protein
MNTTVDDDVQDGFSMYEHSRRSSECVNTVCDGPRGR